MTTTKAKYLGKEGFEFKFQLDNPSKTEIKLKVSKANMDLFGDRLNNITTAMANRSEYWFMIDAGDSWLNTLEPLKEAKKETTLAESIPKDEFVSADNIDTDFIKLRKVKCNVEKKGRFNYVSWTDCWEEVKKFDPNASFKVHENELGFPAFIKKEVGGFVKVSVTIKDQTYTEHFPITDNYNKAVMIPDVFQINTSIKRCLVKCCAWFGLGLYIYQGDDLPSEDKE